MQSFFRIGMPFSGAWKLFCTIVGQFAVLLFEVVCCCVRGLKCCLCTDVLLCEDCVLCEEWCSEVWGLVCWSVRTEVVMLCVCLRLYEDCVLCEEWCAEVWGFVCCCVRRLWCCVQNGVQKICVLCEKMACRSVRICMLVCEDWGCDVVCVFAVVWRSVCVQRPPYLGYLSDLHHHCFFSTSFLLTQGGGGGLRGGGSDRVVGFAASKEFSSWGLVFTFVYVCAVFSIYRPFSPLPLQTSKRSINP
jgi:hypothetical protein